MRKIFLLFAICLFVYLANAQSVKNVFDSQHGRTLQQNLGIAPEDIIDNISIYPNPVVDVLRISFRSSRKSIGVISLFNNIGKQVFNQENLVENSTNLFTVDVRNKAIEPGIYFVQIVVEKEVFTKKIIVK